MSNAWQDIKTAPKDIRVLLYSEALGFALGFWCGPLDDGFGHEVGPWGDTEGPFDLRDDEQPTHWQPLPAPPSAGGAQETTKEKNDHARNGEAESYPADPAPASTD